MITVHDSEQNHQSDNCTLADEISSTEVNTVAKESKSKINNNSSTAEATSNCLNDKHIKKCCQKRGLNREWVEASCNSVKIKEATELLGYTAKSPGILIEGANGQYQFKPDRPWSIPEVRSQKSEVRSSN